MFPILGPTRTFQKQNAFPSLLFTRRVRDFVYKENDPDDVLINKRTSNCARRNKWRNDVPAITVAAYLSDARRAIFVHTFRDNNWERTIPKNETVDAKF